MFLFAGHCYYRSSSLNTFTYLTETYLNFGTGEAGGGSHCNPLASSLVKALATALAAGVGTDGVGGTCCVLLCLTGEPTQSFTRRPNSSANALPSLDDADNSGFMCFIWACNVNRNATRSILQHTIFKGYIFYSLSQ